MALAETSGLLELPSQNTRLKEQRQFCVLQEEHGIMCCFLVMSFVLQYLEYYNTKLMTKKQHIMLNLVLTDISELLELCS